MDEHVWSQQQATASGGTAQLAMVYCSLLRPLPWWLAGEPRGLESMCVNVPDRHSRRFCSLGFVFYMLACAPLGGMFPSLQTSSSKALHHGMLSPVGGYESRHLGLLVACWFGH